VLALEERSRDAGEERGLERAPLRFGLARARSRGERAHDERRHEVDSERDPVLSVTEPECVRGRQEEPVEREHARDRDEEPVREPEEDRDRQHGEDVEHAQAEHGRERVEGEDRPSDDRNRGGAGEQRCDMASHAPLG
jgi:hypothetical protein